MTARKIYTFKLNDSTPNDHPGRVGEITYRDGYLYYHNGVTPGGELIGSGGSGGGGPTTWTSITGKPSFAAVATSGSYADLTNKPNQTLNTSDSVSFNRLTVTGASGIEGGEIELAKAPNSTLAGNVVIDVYENKLRFFEGGGAGRGFYLDLTTGANNTSTNIMSGGGGTAPQGEPGAAGAQGPAGNDGAAGAQGPQGEPGAAGAQGPAGNDGAQGVPGMPGADGADGANGVGVPTGGTVGQVLAKIDSTDYNTEWVDQTSGSGPTNEITNTSASGTTYSVSVGTDGVVTMTTSRGGLEFGALPEPGGTSHFHIMRPAGENGSGGTDLYFGDDYNYVLQRPDAYGQAPAYGVEIGANDMNGGDQQVWRFGTDGTLQLPTGGQVNFTYGAIRQPDANSDLIVSSGRGIKISTDEDADQWTFDTNGNLTLPAGGDIKDSNGNSVLGGGTTLPADASGYLVNDGTGALSWAAGDGTFSGDYNDLINKPTIPADVSDLTDATNLLFSGSYNDLSNTPALFDGDYTNLTNTPALFDGDYTSLANTPSLFSGDYDDLTSKPTLFDGAYSSLTGTPALFSGSYTDLTSKPALFSGSYTDLTDKPTIPTSFSSLVNGSFTASLDSNGELSLPTNAYTEAVIKELNATALVLFAQSTGGNIKLLAGATRAGSAKQWLFNGTDGKLTAPGNLQVDGGKIVLHPYGNAYVESIDYGVDSANSALNIFGGPYQKIKLRAGFGTEATWTFDTSGDLTAPRNIILNNPVTTVTTSVTGTVADSNGNPFTFRILKSANPQLITPFADPNFVLKWTGGDAGSLAAAAQAPGGHGVSSLVSDDGTYWNFNSWYGLGGNRPTSGTVFTVEYGVVDSDTMISTTDTNLIIEADAKQYKFGTDGVLTLPDNSVIASYKPVTVIARPTGVQTIQDNISLARLTFIESVDSVGAFTNSTFTVPYTGYYQFNTTVYFTSDVTLTEGYLMIANTTSGITELDTLYYGAFSGRVINGSSMQYLTTGDTVALFFRQVSGNVVDIGSSSRLTIHRVSID